ncbi:HAMP domain-containing sensor histidine kinase [Flavobacterium sp. CAU 1735]|uniref:sensor histidine kinase n=1 Tax=Flavobacterium sp. CAU 1735 TaxID=3140361 RepID=UPI003261994F
MKINRLNSIIILGLVAIVGIIIAQLLWTKEAFNLEEKKFTQKVHIALLEVAKKLYEGKNHELPANSPINKVSNDYYIVNVDNDFEPEILEYYLKTVFKKFNITTDFEYAMYNCESDEMVYGNYVAISDTSKKENSVYFPKHKNLVYYFAVRFPNETSYLFSSLKFWFMLSFALIVILIVYVYSIFTLLQQKKYSELQRDFINNMTHEFKTPLSSILIASNYLSKQEPIQKDPKLDKYAAIIIEQSKKLNHHIEKILNIAKSDDTPLRLQKNDILLASVLQDVTENIQLRYPEAHITVTNPDESLQIYGDEFHFTNIVYNLIDNAVKYCEISPEIHITVSREAHRIRLVFTDNGIGISQKNISFIFDKFYRIPSTKSNEVTGFGLGLYYVHKICKLHNWKITAKSHLGKGTTITLIIPEK